MSQTYWFVYLDKVLLLTELWFLIVCVLLMPERCSNKQPPGASEERQGQTAEADVCGPPAGRKRNGLFHHKPQFLLHPDYSGTSWASCFSSPHERGHSSCCSLHSTICASSINSIFTSFTLLLWNTSFFTTYRVFTLFLSSRHGSTELPSKPLETWKCRFDQRISAQTEL